MSTTTLTLSFIVLALGINLVLSFRPATFGEPLAFGAIQAVQLGAALGFGVFGFPGMASLPAASWLLVALFLFHAAQNHQRRVVWRTRQDAGEPAVTWMFEESEPDSDPDRRR